MNFLFIEMFIPKGIERNKIDAIGIIDYDFRSQFLKIINMFIVGIFNLFHLFFKGQEEKPGSP